MGLGGRASWGACLARGSRGEARAEQAAAPVPRLLLPPWNLSIKPLRGAPLLSEKLRGSPLLLVLLARIASKPPALGPPAGTQSGSSSAWLFFTFYIAHV